MRGAVSKSGGNASLAGERKVWRTLNGHEGESRIQPRGTCSHLSEPGGQGVHREVGSEGHAEKYRAVVDGGHPVTNRSAKGGARSSPHYGGEGVSHPGPTRHRFSKTPSPRRISSRKSGASAAANRFLAMLSLAGCACKSDRVSRRSKARFSAAVRLRTRLWSSPNVTSSCQCSEFSIPQ